MATLRYDTQQRFTCAGCARCCHSEVAIPPAEHAAYGRARVARWFRASDSGPEGGETDPFLPLPGRDGWFRIRRREDGTCGFLSPQNRCRLHEELGGERKPLVCRMFPFAVHATEREPVMTASFTCPTVVANQGQPVPEQAGALAALRGDWSRAFGLPARRFELVAGRPMSGRAVDALREGLQRLLVVPGGAPVLASNLRRIAAWLEDVSRPRVTRLPPDDLAEYLVVTGRYAAESDRVPAARRPSWSSRLTARGLLFVSGAVEAQRRRPHASGLRVGLRIRMLGLLLHAHGLGPAVAELDAGARGRATLDAAEAAPLIQHYLRAAFTTLGTGRRPILTEAARAAAIADLALALGAMHAVRTGATVVGAASLREGLVRASELDHVEGALAAMVDSFTGGADAFLRLAQSLDR